jgi:hypothetical protein
MYARRASPPSASLASKLRSFWTSGAPLELSGTIWVQDQPGRAASRWARAASGDGNGTVTS